MVGKLAKPTKRADRDSLDQYVSSTSTRSPSDKVATCALRASSQSPRGTCRGETFDLRLDAWWNGQALDPSHTSHLSRLEFTLTS